MQINIDVFLDKIWNKTSILTKTKMKKLITSCLKCAYQQKNKSLKPIKQIFLNVSFVNSNQMKEYNLKYRNKNSDTNVLSFQNENIINNTNTTQPVLWLGEMVLCYEKLQQEAQEYNKPFRDRLYHLFVHSVLHLLGYDHINDNDRIEMETMEQNILKQFGITDLYFTN